MKTLVQIGRTPRKRNSPTMKMLWGEMSRDVGGLNELLALEDRIRMALQQHTLDGVLRGLWNAAKPDRFPKPFMVAGTVLFALRYCAPAFRSMRATEPLSMPVLVPILDLVAQFLLSDPIGFDETVPNSLLSILLRTVGNQFPYETDPFGQQARSLILYVDLPKELASRKKKPVFDFAAAFERTNGVSMQDFVDVGFTAFAAAHSNRSFARDYFDTARRLGVRLPDDGVVSSVLDGLAADPGMLKNLDNQYRQPDRRFAAYDYNPLFPYPIVRPWRQKKRVPVAEDRMTAPLPFLISWRISTGIYYQMRQEHPEFASYFGHLFESYAGKVLAHSVPGKPLLSEQDIRTAYPPRMGKVPDWVVVDGKTAILVECKATRLNRLALATGSEEAIASSLGQVRGGLYQLHEFIQACKAGRVSHPALAGCTDFCPVVLTYEPIYLANSIVFRDSLVGMLDETARNLPWLILSLDELEKLQPHIAAGVEITSLFSNLRSQMFSKVLQAAHEQTGKNYKDSFLYQKDQEIYDRLGVSEEKRMLPYDQRGQL